MIYFSIWKFLVCSAHTGPRPAGNFYGTGHLIINCGCRRLSPWPGQRRSAFGRDVWLAVSRQGLKPRSQESVSERRRGPPRYVFSGRPPTRRSGSFRRKNCIAAEKASEVIVNIVVCRHGGSCRFWPGKVNWRFAPTKHELFLGGEI